MKNDPPAATAAQDIYERHLDTAKAAVRLLRPATRFKDDILSRAFAASVQWGEQPRGSRFVFVLNAGRWALRDAIRSERAQRVDVYLDAPRFDADGNEVGTMHDEFTDDPGDELPDYADLHAAVAELPERERELVERRWFDGDSLRSLAREQGVGHTAVVKQHQKALERLRAALDVTCAAGGRNA